MGEARVSFPGDEKWRAPGSKPCSAPHRPPQAPSVSGPMGSVCHSSASAASILRSSMCSLLLGDAPARKRDCDRQPLCVASAVGNSSNPSESNQPCSTDAN